MFNVIIKYRIIPYLIFSLFLLAGCAVEPTKSLYDPVDTSELTPEITSITPTEGALAGVGEVVINGSNFSSDPDNVMVFFESLQADVKESSPTRIVVQAPNIFGDSVHVKVAIHKVELFSNTVTYKLIPAVKAIGNLMDDDIGYGIAVDMDGNFYVSFSDKEIKKLTPEGATSTFVPATTFLKANNMKMGPDYVIYAAVAAGRIKKIATIQPDGTEGTYVSLAKSPRDLDFDENGNIWVAAEDDIIIVKTDKTTEVALTFPINLMSVRVFNGQLYISGRDDDTGEAKIWKATIQGETLGETQVVLDAAAADWLEGAVINSFTFDEDGLMIIGTDHSPDAMFVFDETDGSHEILYAGLISSAIYAMSWDNGHYLFAVRQYTGEDGDASQLLRLDMGGNGAPYFGRK